MDSDLLDLPLGVKIYVKPRSKPVFCRGKLGEKLQVPCFYFTLDDPYNHHLNIDYNCLHDPHLRDYHKRRDVLKLLKRWGFVTSDNKVVCTLKEFNEYRQYVTRHKLRAEQMMMRKEEWIHPPPATLKLIPELPGITNTSHPRRHKRRRTRLALGQEDAELPSRVGTGADSWGKADGSANGQVKTVFGQVSAAEVQKLQELAETVVLRVFGKLKVPRDQRVSFLRKAAQGIRRRSGSYVGAEPSETPHSHHQDLEAVAHELVATVLDTLGHHLESKISEAEAAARQGEAPADGGATQAEEPQEGEPAPLRSARVEACLDKLTRLVVKNVRNLLKSTVASQFERDSNCEYTEVVELHSSQVSKGQPQPPQRLLPEKGTGARRGLPRASAQQRLAARPGAKLPLLHPQRPAKRTGYARTLAPEILETVEESLEEEGNVTGNTLDTRSMANQIIRSAIRQICQCGPAPTPEEDFQGPTDPRAEGTAPSACPRLPRQPIPPAGPKPPAQPGALRRNLRPKPV